MGSACFLTTCVNVLAFFVMSCVNVQAGAANVAARSTATDMNAGWNSIVTALAHIHMIVG